MRSIAIYSLKSIEWINLPVSCLLIQINSPLLYWPHSCWIVLYRVFISCENKVFTFFHYGMSCYTRTLSLADTEQPIWVSRNPSLFYPFCYSRQSVSLFFPKDAELLFLWPNLICLTQKILLLELTLIK